jgi:hypothetical protein
MAVIKLNKLGGLYPSLLPRNLPEDGAQSSSNLLGSSFEFRPIGNDTQVFTTLGTAPFTAANPKSLYRFDKTSDGSFNSNDTTGWLSSADFKSVVKSQLNNDALGRIYYSSENGVTPPAVISVDGTDRRLGVPAPVAKPTVTLNDVYTFTPERRQIELASAQQQAIDAVLTVGVTRALVGLGNLLPTAGWLLQSDFSNEPFAEKNVIRVFPLDPTTNALIGTYSAMSITEAAWIFDPALNGYTATAPVGYTPPSWAAGHSKWWCITLRAFAEAFDINISALSTALQAIDMPGTQGATKLLTSSEATTMATRLSDIADKDEPAVKTFIDAMVEKQEFVSNLFTRGGAAMLSRAVTNFYSSAPVSTSIEDFKDAYAATIWRYVEMLGTASAQPFYQNTDTA